MVVPVCHCSMKLAILNSKKVSQVQYPFSTSFCKGKTVSPGLQFITGQTNSVVNWAVVNFFFFLNFMINCFCGEFS